MPIPYRRDAVILVVLALIMGTIMAATLSQPGYTDAYYYFNAGQRLVQGKGLTDAAVWTYIGAPNGLPIPSHLYWMPLASLVAALGMFIGGATFHAAQIVFVPLYAGMVLIAFSLGAMIGKSRRLAWFAGLLMLFSGLFMPYWTTTDGFAIYGVVGSGCLLTMGLGRATLSDRRRWLYFALSGALAALAHLTRADGVLLLIVLAVVALWPGIPRRQAVIALIAGVVAYLIVMAPWFVRNLHEIGSILPVGGFQTAWMRGYEEIANYPPTISLGQFIVWGPGNILASRWQAFTNNLGTFVVAEGWIVLTPFMLLAVWRRRRDPLLSGFWLYALGVHAVMTLVFAYPGFRGGLLHSASALMPFWAALGAVGLDEAITWAAKRRRWPLAQARTVFSVVVMLLAIFLSLRTFLSKATAYADPQIVASYQQLSVPNDAVVMINDPPALYYFRGISSVVLPNAPPDTIYTLAQRYGVGYVVIDKNRPPLLDGLWRQIGVPKFLKLTYADDQLHIYRVTVPGAVNDANNNAAN